MRYKNIIIKYIKDNFWMLYLSTLIIINGMTAMRNYDYTLALEEYIVVLEHKNKLQDELITKCDSLANTISQDCNNTALIQHKNFLKNTTFR